MADETGLARMIEHFTRWAASRGDVEGLALAGSHARGDARPGSDVDLMIVTRDPARLLDDPGWVSELGPVRNIEIEEWGAVTSLRVHYAGGLEVELGITTPAWASTDSVDPGTARVVRDGFRILHDPDGLLEALVAAVS